MANSRFKFKKSYLFRSLVIFSVLATILLLYNLVNINFTHGKQNSDNSAEFNLVPASFNSFKNNDDGNNILNTQTISHQELGESLVSM
jgi:hypothetical protein